MFPYEVRIHDPQLSMTSQHTLLFSWVMDEDHSVHCHKTSLYNKHVQKGIDYSTRGKVYWHIWEKSSTSHIGSILIGIYFVKVIRKCKLLILFQEIQPLKYIETCWNHIQQFGRLLDNTYWWDAEYGNEIYWIHFESQRDENFQN